MNTPKLKDATFITSLSFTIATTLLHLRIKIQNVIKAIAKSKQTQTKAKTKPQYGNIWFHTSCFVMKERIPGNANGISPTGYFRVRGFLHATVRGIHWYRLH